jgi:hypothetical protein
VKTTHRQRQQSRNPSTHDGVALTTPSRVELRRFSSPTTSARDRDGKLEERRNAEMQKCRNAEMQKCRNAEMQKCGKVRTKMLR